MDLSFGHAGSYVPVMIGFVLAGARLRAFATSRPLSLRRHDRRTGRGGGRGGVIAAGTPRVRTVVVAPAISRFLKRLDPIHIIARRFLIGVLSVVTVVLPPNYRPSEDEEFMNPLQREYFRQKLLRWRAELLSESTETLQHMKEESLSEPDLADRATLETDRYTELRTRDRERKLISKIDEALQRIEDGTYGYCEETDEPIGVKRLDARPIATLSLEAQERHERMERTHRED